MNQIFFLGTATVGIALFATGLYLYKKPEGDAGEPSPAITDKDDPAKVRKYLSEASDIWTEKTIPLATVSVLWVDNEESKQPVARPKFSHKEINDFWTETVENRPSIYGARKAVIAAILKMLDQAGDCPSVVRNPKQKSEAENKYPDEVFSLLAVIPLWQHSLDVARNMVKRVGRETLVPDAMISSLSHDLGKIPAYHEKGYTTGDHPIISAIVLNGISEFMQLGNRQELEQIVRSHHHLKPHNALANLLKECDQIVRNQEISVKLRQAVAGEHQEPATPKPVQKPAPVTAPIPVAELPQPEEDPDTQPDHPLGHTESEKTGSYVTSRIDLPWLDPDALLAVIKSWINAPSNGRWGAVSMPDGIVYVKDDCLWGTLKKIAPEEAKATLLAADADEASKRNILHSVVWTLSEKRNAIAADMIRDGYYMIPVIIINGSGRMLTDNVLLTPFRAEAFGVLPSDLETAKPPTLRKMVKSIKPKQQAS